jgi:hypothetical protein
VRRWISIVVVVAAGGCKNKQLAHGLPPELALLAAAYDKAERSEMPPSTELYDPEDPVLAPTGLYIHKRQVAELGELGAPGKARELLGMAPRHALHSIVLYPDVPGGTVKAVLDAAAALEWSYVWIGALDKDGLETVCAGTFVRAPKRDPSHPRVISIDIEPEMTWVGQSVINEFIPIETRAGTIDYAKLGTVMKELSAAADHPSDTEPPLPPLSPTIEIGITGQLSRDAYVGLLAATCPVFPRIALVPVEQLAARPQL